MQSTMRALLVLLFCSIPSLPYSQSSTADLSLLDDNALMEAHARMLGLTVDLHTVPAEQDGTTRIVRFGTSSKYGHSFTPTYTLTPDGHVDPEHSSPFFRKRDAIIHAFYCSANAIVVARSLGSDYYLTSNGVFVYTTTTFSVTQILKPSADISVNSDIVALSPGGTFSDKDETLRLDKVGGAPFSKDSYYLLMLPAPIGRNARYVLDPTDTIQVLGSSIIPLGADANLLFTSKDSLPSVVQQWTNVISSVPCSR
jgi:hypothetical protein